MLRFLDGAHAAEQRFGHVVLGEQIAEVAEDVGRGVVELVEQVEQARPDVVAGEAACGRVVAREQVEVVAFVLGQAQGTGERGEDLGRGLWAAGLFQAHVVVGRHAGEL
jgi:hypothetical protein